MVVEVAGSTIVMVSAAAAAIVAAGAMIQAADTYDANAVANLSINVWDRFAGSPLAWAEVTLTYPGGPLEIAGDIRLCMVAPCTAGTVIPECTGGQLHGCWTSRPAGSSMQMRYEGVVQLPFDAGRGDPLGYVVYSRGHSSAGTVLVR